MRATRFTRLSDRDLLRTLVAAIARERGTTAAVLALIAEVDARRLYLPAGYPSMYAYCVGELRLSEESAFKRIHAARTARRFPAIRGALADGRLHLSAVVMVAPHLTQDNAADLLAAVAGKTKSEIEQLLARRVPRPEVPARLEAISPDPLTEQHAPGRVGKETAPESNEESTDQHAPGRVAVPGPKLAAVAPERFVLQLTIGKDTHDRLRYAQALLSHRIPSGDLAAVLDEALQIAIGQLEKCKFAATRKPRPAQRRPTTNGRYIPAHVKRAVWQRDGARCTFVSGTGRRCPARTLLEFDHVEPVARGGQATLAGVRLRCRAHNQYEAERTFGAGFMSEKRDAARRAAAARRPPAAAARRAATQDRARDVATEDRARDAATEDRARDAATENRARAVVTEDRAAAVAAQPLARAASEEHSKDVMACLRELGFRTEQVRRATEFCSTLPDATLEERVRAALKFLCPKPRFHGRTGASLETPA